MVKLTPEERERKRAYARAWHTARAGLVNARRRRAYSVDRDRVLARQRLRGRTPAKIASVAIWKKENRGLCNSGEAKRKATKLQATPAWADHEAIKDVYLEAAYQGMTVDHIVPLQGRNVCGLHWEGNLQLLTASQNSAKGNRLLDT